MTDGLLWGGFNLRKFCKILLGNFWMIIAVMIITFLGLSFLNKRTYTPYYRSTAVAAVYPKTSSYNYHTIETVWDLSSKTSDISSMFNSDLFQSGLYNQYPSLKNCTIESMLVPNTDLLILHASSDKPGNTFEIIWATLEYYSQFSGNMTGAPEIRIILGPKEPHLTGSSKISFNRSRLCILSGIMMAGLLFLLYVLKATYKTELSIKKRHKNVRFFSLPFISSETENKKRLFLSKKNSQEPIRKLAIEINQVLHKCNKKTLLVTTHSDKGGESVILSELARELAAQKEKVLILDTGDWQRNNDAGLDSPDDTKKYTLLNVLQQKCTVKDAIYYSEELEVQCIRSDLESSDEDVFYTIDDINSVLSECLEHADIVLINNGSWFLSRYAQIWHEAADASIALCPQYDAAFFKVDKMLNDLQNSETYFTGCVLLGF